MLKYLETVHLEDMPYVGAKTVEHCIVYEGPVFFNRQYRTPHVLKDDIQKEVDRLIKEDLIEGAESEFNNAYLPVAKRDLATGKLKLRLVLDLRKFNENIAVDRLPISDINDLLNELHGAKYLTVLDAASGYLQISLTKDSRKYTAFRHHNNAYQYKRMCFGLGSAPSTWIRFMNLVTSGLSNVFCYMDDILIYSNTMEEHLKTLNLVLKRFSYHGLELSLKIC